MSILIKGIEMPKEPWECPCHNGENGRGKEKKVMEKVIRNDKVIINQSILIKKEYLEEIQNDIRKRFEEERIIFIPYGLTAQVVRNDVLCEEEE